MAKKMIVTNLRMEENDYLQAKQLAAEMNMSLNEYFNYLAETHVLTERKDRSRKLTSIYKAFAGVGKRKFKDMPMGATEEDKIIYGIE